MIRCLWLVVIVFLLFSCGGGSSSPPPSDDGLSQLLPPNGGTVNDPAAPPVVNNPEINRPTGLEVLLGNTVFSYQFENSEAIFSVVVQFSADDITVDSGRELLLVIAQTFARITPDADPMRGQDRSFSCTFVEASGEYFCNLDPLGDMDTLFLFGSLDENREATGVFEFCSANEQGLCVNELLNTPDGRMLVTVFDIAADSVGTSALPQVIQPYLEYYEQGSADKRTISAKTGLKDTTYDALNSARKNFERME